MRAHDRAVQSGFTLVELLIAVGVTAMLGAVASLAVRGFAGAGVGARCRTDTLRLRKAESVYFIANDRYGDESELVAVALLDGPSVGHDVELDGGAYAITEVGACIGQGSAYGIPAPTVGTTAHSGTTVAVVAPDGSGLAGVGASYRPDGGATWLAMGTTDSSGRTGAELPDGVYDLRVTYDGAVNTLSQVTVTTGTLVTFPAVPLTVALRDPHGDGLSGGSVAIGAGGGPPVDLGTTAATGELVTDVLPGGYDVTLTYGSATSTRTAVAVTGPTVVDFQVCATAIRLLAVDGTGLASGVVTATPASGGGAIALGSTDASGTVTAALLDGTYDITMQFSGETSTQTVAISGAPTVVFHMVTVTVHLAESGGAPLTGGDAAAWYRPEGAAAFERARRARRLGQRVCRHAAVDVRLQGSLVRHRGLRERSEHRGRDHRDLPDGRRAAAHGGVDRSPAVRRGRRALRARTGAVELDDGRRSRLVGHRDRGTVSRHVRLPGPLVRRDARAGRRGRRLVDRGHVPDDTGDTATPRVDGCGAFRAGQTRSSSARAVPSRGLSPAIRMRRGRPCRSCSRRRTTSRRTGSPC